MEDHFFQLERKFKKLLPFWTYSVKTGAKGFQNAPRENQINRVEPQLYSSYWFKKVQNSLLKPSNSTLKERTNTQLAQIQSEFADDVAGLDEVENVEAKINKRYFSCHDSEQILAYHGVLIERKL